MARRPRLDEEVDDEDDDLADPVAALLAGLLLVMTCPTCEGTGKKSSVGAGLAETLGLTGKASGTCECRAFGHKLALQALSEEGLVG